MAHVCGQVIGETIAKAAHWQCPVALVGSHAFERH